MRPKMRVAATKCKVDFHSAQNTFAVSFRLSFQLLTVVLERERMNLAGSTRGSNMNLPRVFCRELIEME